MGEGYREAIQLLTLKTKIFKNNRIYRASQKSKPHFLQLKIRITSHRTNLKVQNMEQRITSNEMIREQWIPMLTQKTG